MKTHIKKINIKLLAVLGALTAALAGSGLCAFEYSGRAAREEAMGGAFVALADDASCVFQNPAGLASLYGPELLTGYGGLYVGLDDGEITSGLLSAVYPVNRRFLGGLGLGWSRLGAGGLYSENTFLLGYGVSALENLDVGAGLKVLNVGYGRDEYTRINPVFDSGYESYAFTGDLGALYRLNGYTLGLGLYNITAPDVGLKYRSRVPLSVKAGVNMPSVISNLALQGEYSAGDTAFAVGGERNFFTRHLKLRGGLRLGSRRLRTASAGISYSDSWYRVDYTLVYPLTGISETLGTHKINISFYPGERQVPEFRRVETVMAPDDLDIPDFMRVSIEEMHRSREFMTEARELKERGEFEAARDLVNEALEAWEGNREASALKSELEPVADIYESLDAAHPLGARAITAYFEGRGREALNRSRYASQLNPGDDSLRRLRDIVERRFSSLAAQDKMIPGLTVVEQKLQEALESIYDKKWVRAITLCEDVLDLEPRNVLALKRMGSAYFGMGNRERAREIWERALAIDPGDRELQEYLGIREREPAPEVDEALMREFESAVNYYRQLVGAGAGEAARIRVLERIISTYRDTEIDISSLEQELERLRR